MRNQSFSLKSETCFLLFLTNMWYCLKVGEKKFMTKLLIDVKFQDWVQIKKIFAIPPNPLTLYFSLIVFIRIKKNLTTTLNSFLIFKIYFSFSWSSSALFTFIPIILSFFLFFIFPIILFYLFFLFSIFRAFKRLSCQFGAFFSSLQTQ